VSGPAAISNVAVGARVWSREAVLFAAVVVATVAVWGHTVDELRIGEFSAVPASLLNAALLVAWPRAGRRARGWMTMAFGLWWTVTVVPYHVLPLLNGAETEQNISGLLRLAGGLGMIGVTIPLLWTPSTPRAK
jgi:hypothetical protein